MQMINHEVGILVSAINKPKNQWKIKGKVKKMRCSRRQDEKQQDAVSNGTVAAGYCAFRKPFPTSQHHCQLRNTIANFTSFAKFTLRNLQALSSSVINAEPPSIFGVLLFCPIT